MAGFDGNNAALDDDQACLYALELLGGFIVPMTLKAVMELGIIDQLLAANGRMVTMEELVAQLPQYAEASAVMLDRMLRFLASHSVVRCSTEVRQDGVVHRSYAAAPVCKWLAGNGTDESVAPLGTFILDKVFMDSWYYMKDAVLEGAVPSEKAYGMSLFEFIGRNESANTMFNTAMAGHSAIITKKLLERFNGLDGLSVLIDVGGGTGAMLQTIIGYHKHLRGINYDLPHVIGQAPSIKGVEHIGGSMFESIPSGDAVLMKWILHMWGDEDCIKILKNCYAALPTKGKVLLLEYILPVSPEPTPRAQGAFLLDLAMLNRFGNGKERTEQEFTALAMKAGFSGEHKATYIFTNVWVLEFTK